jgi:hypothetical protein
MHRDRKQSASRAASVGSCSQKKEAGIFRFPSEHCAGILVAVNSGEAACITGCSTRTPKGVRARGAPVPRAPVNSNVMPQAVVSSLMLRTAAERKSRVSCRRSTVMRHTAPKLAPRT